MSKQEVLTQVYPDELEYIFRKKREKEINQYESYRHTMIAVAAGFGGKTEDGETLFEIYSRQLNEIIGQLESVDKSMEEKEYTPDGIDKELAKLRGLQGIISQTQVKRKK